LSDVTGPGTPQEREGPLGSAPAAGGRGLTRALIEDVVAGADAEDVERVRALMRTLHPADAADLLELVGSDRRPVLIRAIRDGIDGETLIYLDSEVLEEVVDQLDPADVARAVAALDADDATALIDELDQAERREILDLLPAPERAAVEEGLAFVENSAGRLMQRDLVSIPVYWTVGHVIDYLREAQSLPDEFYEIFVVDPRHRPIGKIPLYRAMRSQRPVKVSEIMDRNVRAVDVGADREDVAFLFSQYDLLSAAVVDGSGRLVGMITVDDVVDVIQEEAEEDIMRLGGVIADDLHAAPWVTARRRSSWLFVNLITALVASAVIGFFDATIEQVVALAILMPIVASMGGNTGTQALTVTVRALAQRQVGPANVGRVVLKEVGVGALNGIGFAVLMGAIAGFWFQDPLLGIVMAAAIVINLVTAGLAGAAVPLVLHRVGVDPAIAASVFLTAITDVVGFFAFLGLGTWLLL